MKSKAVCTTLVKKAIRDQYGETKVLLKHFPQYETSVELITALVQGKVKPLNEGQKQAVREISKEIKDIYGVSLKKCGTR